MKITQINKLKQLFEDKKYEQVVKSINFNIQNNYSNGDQIELLGLAYLELNLFDNSIKVFNHLINEYKYGATAKINLAVAYKRAGKIKEAIEVYSHLLEKYPNSEIIHNNIGTVYKLLKNIKKSIFHFKKALELKPSYAQPYINIAKIYDENKKIKLSEKILRTGLKETNFDTKIIEALSFTIFNYAEKKVEGIRLSHLLIKKNKANSNIYHNVAYYLQNKNKFKFALKYIKYALKLNNKFSNAYNTWGIILYKKGYLLEAKKKYLESLKHNPNCYLSKFNLGVIYIRTFRSMHKGWLLIEERRLNESPIYQKYKKKVWDGNFVNNLYIWNEQGIGDEISYLNTLENISKLAKNINVHLDNRIISLVKRNLLNKNIKNIKILPSKTKKYGEKFKEIKKNDAHVSLISLPQYILKSKNDFNKINFPYLSNSKKFTKYKINKNKINIGLSWKTTNKNEQHRNIPLNFLKKILNNHNFHFHNLQFNVTANEIAFFKSACPNFVFNKNLDYRNDFNNLSKLILNLDLVITIQNTIAHLSLALNKKSIVFIENHCRIQWGYQKSTSPWYPEARIIRNNIKNSLHKKDKFEKILDAEIKKALNL